MPTLRWRDARACVLQQLAPSTPAVESVPLDLCEGRVLAHDAVADRDYPPCDRSIRDGFAVRAADLPGLLAVSGEVRAGEAYSGTVMPGQAVEIMTGALVPEGADTVVMVEHTTREGGSVRIERMQSPGLFVNAKGAECAVGDTVCPVGTRLDAAHIAALATIGLAQVPVFRKPRVAILATGDEVVPVESQPLAHQVRNANSHLVAAQVRRAGGEPVVLPTAADSVSALRESVRQGLEADLLLLSGGVSAGKYDYVEQVLAEFGAEFLFDRVLIQPGQPLVFGLLSHEGRQVPFFGLPGNPASTLVTFLVFAQAALQRLAGVREPWLPVLSARLTQPFTHKTGLTRFLPASLEADQGRVTPVPWQGSSDVFALARANAFLVADEEREAWQAGESIEVLLRA